MELDRLYKIDCSGKKRIWYATVHCDRYVTHSGIDEGKIQDHVHMVAATDHGDKRHRKQADRALFKATSEWNLKRSKGGMVTAEELDKLASQSAIYPISPILAQTYKGSLKSIQGVKGAHTNWIIQYKYDGLRCIASLVGGDCASVDLNSRGRKPWPFLDHIRLEVKKVLSCLPRGWHLDGELYIHGKSTEHLISVVRGKDDVIHPDNRNVKYIVYDLVDPDGKFDNYARQTFMTALIPSGKFVHVLLAPMIGSLVVTSTPETPTRLDDQIQTFLLAAEKDGYEGIMLRNQNMVYKRGLNVRSKMLLKVKNFIDEEVTIVGCTQGKDGHEGCMIFEVETEKGHKLSVNAHGTLDYRKELWNSHTSGRIEFQGMSYTIKYKELNYYGVPKFAVGVGFRDADDK